MDISRSFRIYNIIHIYVNKLNYKVNRKFGKKKYYTNISLIYDGVKTGARDSFWSSIIQQRVLLVKKIL